jgi:hypothetical protein
MTVKEGLGGGRVRFIKVVEQIIVNGHRKEVEGGGHSVTYV